MSEETLHCARCGREKPDKVSWRYWTPAASEGGTPGVIWPACAIPGEAPKPPEVVVQDQAAEIVPRADVFGLLGAYHAALRPGGRAASHAGVSGCRADPVRCRNSVVTLQRRAHIPG